MMIYSSKLSRSRLEELDRRLQEELAGLEREKQQRVAEDADPSVKARREFDALQREYKFGVADILAFFPEDEAIAYLSGLMDGAVAPHAQQAAK